VACRALLAEAGPPDSDATLTPSKARGGVFGVPAACEPLAAAMVGVFFGPGLLRTLATGRPVPTFKAVAKVG